MNQTMEFLRKRTSLRNYSQREMLQEHLDIIIEGAMRAPTAGNMMPYSIIVVKNKEKKEILSQTCDQQPFISKSPVILIFVADYQKWMDYYRINNVEKFCSYNKREYTRPSEASLFLATEDALIAAQNAVIAAESIGVGSCYIGDIMEHYETHKELFNLPEYAFPVAMLCLGYYPENYNQLPKERFDKKYIVFNEKYEKIPDKEIKHMFKHLESRWTPGNKYNAENYAQMHYAFKTNADFSKEMARSIREVLKIWNGENINKV